MDKTLTEKLGRNIRLSIFIWVMLANALIAIFKVEHSWLIFFANIFLFALPGEDMKDKLKTVTFGALVGMVLTYILMLIIGLISPKVGEFLGFMLPLGLGLYLLIVESPRAPKLFNSVGFAYLTLCALHGEDFIMNFPKYILIFIIGSLALNISCLYLIKLVKKRTLDKYSPELNLE